MTAERLRRLCRAAALVCCAAVVSPLVLGQTRDAPSGPGRAWSSLSAAQRSALAPLEHDWAGLDAARQQKWLEIAGRLPSLAPDQRQRVQERMNGWANRTPLERGQARINFQQARQLSREDREERWQAYQALPAEQKRKLAERGAPAQAAPRATAGLTERDGSKSNLVRATGTAPLGKAVAPTVVQAAPGATTTLVTRPARPPLHQQAGMPKIVATPGFVDATTLLPQRGAQAAATRSATAASVPAPQE